MNLKLLLYILSVFLLINVMGCSVARFTQTRMMEGVKKINKTDLKLDFKLDYDPTNRSLSINLAHQPYSIYKPKITLVDLGVGLTALGIWGAVFYDNWDHDYTFDFSDDTFDWYGMEWWETAVLIGVPADILLYWAFSYPIDRKMIRLDPLPLKSHPYRIELPNHADIGINYTTSTGDEEIVIKEFLSELRNSSYLLNNETLKFRVKTEVGGKEYNKYYTAPIPSKLIPPISKDIKIDVDWDKKHIRAGDRAILKITVTNNSKTTLTEFTATTASSNVNFDNWELIFGDIPTGKVVTRTIGFRTDTNESIQDITVNLSFNTTSGNVATKTPDILLMKK